MYHTFYKIAFIVNIIIVNIYRVLRLINTTRSAVCFLCFCFSWRSRLKALGINALLSFTLKRAVRRNSSFI